MNKALSMTRFAPLFAAGFLMTALTVSGLLTGASVAGLASARLLAAPVTELFELFASLAGGAAAAAAFGREKIASK